jgi:hypothetical protein
MGMGLGSVSSETTQPNAREPRAGYTVSGSKVIAGPYVADSMFNNQ